MSVLTGGEGTGKLVRLSGIDFWASGLEHTGRTAGNGTLSPCSNAKETGKYGNWD